MVSEIMTKQQLFGDIDFLKLAEDKDFKEDSVREVIILPILKHLGYKEENIIRSKTLIHPFLKIGSNKKREIKLIPDYLLKVDEIYAWVLDAKSPSKKIVHNENVGQVYSYAMHPEIRSKYFALCNGIEFSLFLTENPNEPILLFSLGDIENHWDKLSMYLSPTFLRTGKRIAYPVETQRIASLQQKNNEWYKERPLLLEIPVKKRAARRHFGVHGYFTKQSWNIVQNYIKNYTSQGDVVLDPFGGSGVTAIEALMIERKGINIDLNPMAVFLVQSLVAPVNLSDFADAFEKVKTEYLKHEPKTKEEIKKVLQKHKGCKSLPLPKSSDVPTTDLLFSKKQMAQLALLKSIIKKQKNENIRNSLLLCFSGTVTRVNLTYHISTAVTAGTGFGGNAAAFQYYRYRIAKKPTNVDVMQCFELRYKNIVKAKEEMSHFIDENTVNNLDNRKGTATDLSFLKKESVDYIYTDPPYGKKIPYLDLSAMWNAWLDLDVSEEDFQMEAIEGGEHNKTKEEYNEMIAQSIKEMYRVLKFDRWLSFVFAHKDPEFWDLIISTAESCGFEYAGTVSQKNGQTSFKKRQNPFTVLTGQLIINFRKVRNPRSIMGASLGMTITETIMQTIEGVIAKHNGATIEQINDEMIIRGLELGFLHLLVKEYSDLTPILKSSFDYNPETELYTIRKGEKLTSHIPVEVRIKYYLSSYLLKMDREEKKKYPTFDEIVFNIMPLLKNGTTPENQTILGVLKEIAEPADEQGCWKLKQNGQRKLFE